MRALAGSRSAQVMRFALGFAGWRWSAWLFATIFISSVVDLLGIAVIFPYLRIVIDPDALAKAVQMLPAGLRQGAADKHLLIALSVLLIAAYAGKSACQALLMRYQNRRLANLTTRLTEDIVANVLHARYSMFLETPASEIGVAAYSNPIHVTLTFKAALQILNEAAFIGLLLIAFLVISPLPTLLAVVLLSAVGALIYVLVIRDTSRLGKEQNVIENMRHRLMFSMINTIRDIKVMGLASLFQTLNREASADYERVAWRYNFNYALPLQIIEFAVLIGVVGTVMAVLLADVPVTETLPVVGVLAIAAIRTVPAVAKLFAALNSFSFYSEPVLSFEKLRSRLIAARHVRTPDRLDFADNIELREVSFAYGDKKILDRIDFKLEAGRCYGIVGPSGSGKSTLLDVLTGLQEAASGRFLCDGATFDPFASTTLSRLVGYVPQSITLIDDSIAFNITFEHQYDRDRLKAAIRMANLEAFVAALPEGVDTRVGDNGARLSGGQRQRIGIARAFYRNPRILVLDEATSALDARTEREIADELVALRGTMTMLIVSHRISAVEDCDEILVMVHGAVIDRGRHEDLLGRCDLYRELHQLQNALE